ncbi:MAG: uncharacterized protein JWO08_988 [Verrucomicrobiaceae bacterium]|nr:uncharacterized protein [Verrucomicrobiaceae bacterium]
MTEELPEEDLEARWPKDGDRLFISSAWAYDAHVIRDPKERFYRLPIGYKRAGDLLIEQAMADVVDRRNVIYPILFCYRQSIELFLKQIITDFGTPKEKLNHDLDTLWKQFLGIADERSNGGSEVLSAVQQIVLDMHEADKKADGFRFATDRKQNPFEFGDRGIDLANLREVMQGVTNFFECVDQEFREQNDLSMM